MIPGKKDKGLDWLCSLIIKNYGDLNHKINFVQNLRSSEDYIYKHVLNVAILSAIIAGQMGFPVGRINLLVKSAILHDIGALKLQQLLDAEDLDDGTKEVVKKNTQETLARYGDLMRKFRASLPRCRSFIQARAMQRFRQR